MHVQALLSVATFCACMLTFATPAETDTERGFREYVALGDSFSTGVGAGQLLHIGPALGQDCRRSTEAWPYHLALSLGMNDPGKVFRFSACIAMNAEEIRERQIQDPDADFGNPDLVSLTMGANDMGILGQFVHKCIQDRNCGRALADTRDFVSGSAEFEKEMAMTLQAAGTFNPPPPPLKRTLIVMGYVAPFNFHTKWNPLKPRVDTVINMDSRRRVDEIIDIINWKLQDTVDRAGNGSFRTIWINPNQAFLDHRLAEPSGNDVFLRGFGGLVEWKRMLNPKTLASALKNWQTNFVTAGVMHPNQQGQSLLADLARSQLAS